MTAKPVGKGEYQIPSKHFLDVAPVNPWAACVFSGVLGMARGIDDAVAMTKERGLMLPSAQELAAYLISSNQHADSYWVRSTAHVSRSNGELRLAILDDADPKQCITSSYAKELIIGQYRGYLANPRGGSSAIERARFKSSLEGRTMTCAPVGKGHLNLSSEKNAEVLEGVKEWAALFGPLSLAYGKHVFRKRKQAGLATEISLVYPDTTIVDRDRLSVPEGLRAVRIGPLDATDFYVSLGASFRDAAKVIGVRFPQDFYAKKKE